MRRDATRPPVLLTHGRPQSGGHFLAFEEPALIGGELGAFMRDVG